MAAKKVVPQQSKPSFEPILQVWGWVLLMWALYRYFLHLPEWVDELVAKPLVFLGPVFWYVLKKERRTLESVGITLKNLFPSLYIGLAFGMIFALEGLAAHVLKYGEMRINPIEAFQNYGFALIGLSIATAFCEEVLSRGFVFNRLYEKMQNLPMASIMSALMFLTLHVPILVTTNKLTGTTLVLFIVTDLVLAMANSLLFYNLGSVVAPILVHVFWNMTVALYL